MLGEERVALELNEGQAKGCKKRTPGGSPLEDV